MLTVAQPQGPVAETDPDGINGLARTDPLELQTVVVRLRMPEGLGPRRLCLDRLRPLREARPELLRDTCGHDGG